MRRLLPVLAGILIGLSFIISIVFTSAEALTYNQDFYLLQAKQYQSIKALDVNEQQYSQVTQVIISYLKGDLPQLSLKLSLNDTKKEMFTPIEQSHMQDVRNVFMAGSFLRYASIVILLMLLLYIVLKQDNLFFVRTLKTSVITIFIVVSTGALAAVLASIDFYTMFTLFHKILFTNSNWLLPDDSTLITMLPEEFFMTAAAKIALWVLGSLAVAVGIMLYFIRKGNPIALKRRMSDD